MNEIGPEATEQPAAEAPRAGQLPSSHPPLNVPDYELLRLIGRGAYGEVWLARSVMGAYRAVKVVYRQSFDHDRPYEREFAGIQKFEPISRSHDSQVDILHVGRNAAEGYFYYVMELADNASDHGAVQQSPTSGLRTPSARPERQSDQASDSQREGWDWQKYIPKTLKRELQQRGRLPVDECVQLGLTLTTALEHLHQNSLVHRDVKPSNIIFVNGRPKLADIGLVSSLDATRSQVGTPGFAPPEGPGTVPGDLYSLGKMLYEAATGRDRQEFPELPTQLGGTVEEESALVELNQVILKACDNQPGHRYQSAAAMRADLEVLEKGRSLLRRRSTRKRLNILVRSAVVLACLFVGALMVWNFIPTSPKDALPMDSRPRPASPPPATAEAEPVIPDEAERFHELRDAMQSRADAYQRLVPSIGQGSHNYWMFRLNTKPMRFEERYYDAVRFTTPPAADGAPDMVWSFYQVDPQQSFSGWTIFPAAGNDMGSFPSVPDPVTSFRCSQNVNPASNRITSAI